MSASERARASARERVRARLRSDESRAAGRSCSYERESSSFVLFLASFNLPPPPPRALVRSLAHSNVDRKAKGRRRQRRTRRGGDELAYKNCSEQRRRRQRRQRRRRRQRHVSRRDLFDCLSPSLPLVRSLALIASFSRGSVDLVDRHKRATIKKSSLEIGACFAPCFFFLLEFDVLHCCERRATKWIERFCACGSGDDFIFCPI